MTTKKPDRLLRMKSVLERTGLSRSGLYRRMQDGTFPKSIKISARCVAWRESEIAKWERREARRSTPGAGTIEG